MVLVKDEAGVLTWHFAGADAGARGRAPTYTIDRRVVVAAEGRARDARPRLRRRHEAAQGGRVPAHRARRSARSQTASPGRWEAKKRPYRLRWSTPDDFATARRRRRPAGRLGQARTSSGRSCSCTAPSAAPTRASASCRRATFEELHAHYERTGDRARPLHALPLAAPERRVAARADPRRAPPRRRHRLPLARRPRRRARWPSIRASSRSARSACRWAAWSSSPARTRAPHSPTPTTSANDRTRIRTSSTSFPTTVSRTSSPASSPWRR